MGYRDKIVSYVRTYVDPEFDADGDVLFHVLDSVSLLQLALSSSRSSACRWS